MKYITLSFLLVAILFFSCENQDTLITEEILPEPQEASLVVIDGIAVEQFSKHYYNIGRQPLNNVSVRLMLDGVTLDEVNTNEVGKFQFDEQAVPIDEAYLIFEAPGFYRNVAKVNSITNPDINIPNTPLIRKTFEELDGDAITDDGSYIRLTGGPANPDFLSPLFYVTNSDNKLVGAQQQFVESTFTEITTIANEPLNLHYLTECSTGSVRIGPFSEDTDITSIMESFSLEDRDWDFFEVLAYECTGGKLEPEEFDIFYKENGLTKWKINNSNFSNFGGHACSLAKDPNILVTVATQDPRMYGEVIHNYTPNMNPSSLTITICESDDTYLNYSIGGAQEVEPNLFTFANILPNGDLLLKLKDPLYPGGTDISFQISDSSAGSMTQGDVLFTNWPDKSINVNKVGNDLDITITSNDGNFVEGTFDGPIYDAFEASLGNLTGSFRARIQ